MPCCTVFPQSQCSLYFSFCLPSLCSGLVLLLGTVLEDLGELVVVKHSILDRRLSVHLVHLLLCEPVLDGGQQLPQPVLVHQPHVVLVETSEGILDNVLRVSSLVNM